MAAYIELRTLFSDTALLNRIEVACIVAAKTIRNEGSETPNHVDRLLWAQAAYTDPSAMRHPMLRELLAENKDSTVQQITDVLDTDLQTLVDAAVDLFATGS